MLFSQHSATLISSVLTQTLAKSAEFGPEEEEDQADKTDIDDDIPPLQLTAMHARSLFATIAEKVPEDALQPSTKTRNGGKQLRPKACA